MGDYSHRSTSGPWEPNTASHACALSTLPKMSEDQLKVEVDWCLARLEEKLAAMDPYSRPAQEAAKVHRILKSSKAPVIKKRQAMRNMFGDYREKMRAMEKKQVAAMKKSKLVPIKEPPSESKFLRRSTGALLAQNTSDSSTSTATTDSHQLSTKEDSCAASSQSDAAETPVPATSAAENPVSAPVGLSGVPPSEGEFKFDFGEDECGPDAEGVNKVTAPSSGMCVQKNYFVIKPSNEEFRFNFAPDDDDHDT